MTNHGKCVAPLPFFFLPLIPLGGCANAPELEARIRTAWSLRERNLRAAAQKLSSLGITASPESGGQVLAFSLGHDDAAAALRMLDAQRVILPGRGPLSSLRAASPEQRTARVDPAWSHASDAEIALTAHLDKLSLRLANERSPLILPVHAPSRPTSIRSPARRRELVVQPFSRARASGP